VKILLANPRGFCAGVDRAIEIVERAIGVFGPPIHVRHEVVHNRHVVERLRALGAVFVDELDQVPDGATVIFSAHGVPRAVSRKRAARPQCIRRHLPARHQVHMRFRVRTRRARSHPDRPCGSSGGRGTMASSMRPSAADPAGGVGRDVARLEIANPARVAFVTQTTLSVDDTAEVVDALRVRFPALAGPRKEDICYATQSRQDAVKRLRLTATCSSWSARARARIQSPEGACGARRRARYLVDGRTPGARLVVASRRRRHGGASAPEILVAQWSSACAPGGNGGEEMIGRPEHVIFSLPKSLRSA